MIKQKFNRGDLVHVAKDLGECMSHFTADVDAIVLYSYGDEYGEPGSGGGYGLHLKDHGQCAWYEENQLALIDRNRSDLLEQWKREEKELQDKQSDLDWVFSNYDPKGMPGCSIQALADCLDIGSLWGSRGEGVDYHFNALTILGLAEPYLETGDKAGWIAWAEDWKVNGIENNEQLTT